MVQRLSLYGVLASSEFEMASSTIQIYTGMLPRVLKESRQVWHPFRRYDNSAVRGQATQVEQYKLFMVETPHQNFIESTEPPEIGRNISVISQSMIASQVKQGSITDFMRDIGYEFESSHEVKGYEFVHEGSLVIKMFRLEQNSELLDPSGQWIVCCYVDVDHVTNLKAVEQGTKILLNCQHDLRYVCALGTPQRNAFNTKMPRSI